MKKLLSLAVMSTLVATMFAAPASAAGGTSFTSDTFYENTWYTSSSGWIYTPFALYTTASTTYDYPGDATVKITKMDNFVAWKQYKGFQYSGYVSLGAVNWYKSDNTPAGTYSLTNTSSYYADPADLSLGKNWTGTMWQLVGNYEMSTYSWTCTSSCTPLTHNESLGLWF